MKISKPDLMIDGVSELGDKIEVRVQARSGGYTLYVDVNGQIVLRIGHIASSADISYKLEGEG